jgi:hypothetical protein
LPCPPARGWTPGSANSDVGISGSPARAGMGRVQAKKMRLRVRNLKQGRVLRRSEKRTELHAMNYMEALFTTVNGASIRQPIVGFADLAFF